MAKRPLLRDSAGNVILPGPVNKTLTEDFLITTALPAWLAAPTGTATFQNMSVDRGQVTLTTSGATGSDTELRASQRVDLSKVEAVMWTVDGFYVDASSGINMYMGLSDATFGAYIAAAVNPTARYSGDSGGVLLRDDWMSNNEWQRHKSRSVLIDCQAKHTYLLEHGQVIADVEMAGMSLGPVYPSIKMVQSLGTTARNLRIGRVSLTISTY